MKYLFLSLVALLAMCSCSSDDNSETKANGQYVFKNDTLLVALQINDGIPYKFDAYINGGSVSQFYFSNHSGEYPNISVDYYDNGIIRLNLDCVYNNVTSFTASVVSCNLERANWAWYYAYKIVVIPTRMYFVKDDTTLDINGDGILDSTQ